MCLGQLSPKQKCVDETKTVSVKTKTKKVTLKTKTKLLGKTSHSTHYRSYGDDFTGQMTQPTVS